MTGARTFSSAWIPKCYDPEDIAISTAHLAQRLEEFYHRARETCRNFDELCHETQSSLGKEWLLAAIREAKVLNEEILDWSHCFPATWTSPQVPEPNSSQNASEHSFFQTNQSRWLACFWAQTQCWLINFHTSTAACCERLLCLNQPELSPELSPERKMARATNSFAKTNAMSLISHVYKSILFCLGEAQGGGLGQPNSSSAGACGYLLLWPLAVVKQSRFATPEQRTYCGAALGHVGSTMGLRIAGVIAETVTTF